MSKSTITIIIMAILIVALAATLTVVLTNNHKEAQEKDFDKNGNGIFVLCGNDRLAIRDGASESKDGTVETWVLYNNKTMKKYASGETVSDGDILEFDKGKSSTMYAALVSTEKGYVYISRDASTFYRVDRITSNAITVNKLSVWDVRN